jgi:GTPase SAR1 family protein
LEDAHLILVATKADVRTMSDRDIAPTRKLLLPRYYIETSAKTGANVPDLFATIARIVVNPSEVPVPVHPEPPAPPPPPAAPEPPAGAAPVRRPEANTSRTCLML